MAVPGTVNAFLPICVSAAPSAPETMRLELREAEVENLQLAASVDEDVARLDVAMDDAFACAASRASAI